MSYKPNLEINKILRGKRAGSSFLTPPTRPKKAATKAAKRIDLNATFYDFPGNNVLDMEEIPQSLLTKLGFGPVQLLEEKLDRKGSTHEDFSSAG